MSGRRPTIDYAEKMCSLCCAPAAGAYGDKTGHYYLCQPHLDAVLARYFNKSNLTRLAEANQKFNAAQAAGELSHGNV